MAAASALLVVGIEPDRVTDVEVVHRVSAELSQATADLQHWRAHYRTHREAKAAHDARRKAALDELPPIGG